MRRRGIWGTCVSRREDYRAELRALAATQWPAYLRANSGLPGPRANLELAGAVADEGDRNTFDLLIASDDEYLVLCGVLGLGRLMADGADVERRLREHASDPRWRVREGVATALQRLGDADLPRLVDIVRAWSAQEDPLVQRAAVAAICEPRLLKTPTGVDCALKACVQTTSALVARADDERREAAVRTLRQALGYCWSLAVAADPATGLPIFRALAKSTDLDLAWIVRENSRKARLAKLL